MEEKTGNQNTIQGTNIEEIVNRFLEYCGKDTTSLTNKQKLNQLRDRKVNLQVDLDIYYEKFSNTEDPEIKDQYFCRMEADDMAISELNICIRYLKQILKEENSIFAFVNHIKRKVMIKNRK